MNEQNDKPAVILKATLKRLPLYYNYLKEKEKVGELYVSSTVIAKSLKLNPIQIRKDLAYVSKTAGKPRMGFEISPLIEDMENFLGYKNVDDAVLVGVGRLGRTLLSYNGFQEYGLNIVAGFDVDEDIIGLKINGKPIMPIQRLKQMVERLNINIGIITVSSESAQNVCDLLVGAGIKAIWNFVPTHIEITENVIIKNENLAASLAGLSHELLNSLK